MFRTTNGTENPLSPDESWSLLRETLRKMDSGVNWFHCRMLSFQSRQAARIRDSDCRVTFTYPPAKPSDVMCVEYGGRSVRPTTSRRRSHLIASHKCNCVSTAYRNDEVQPRTPSAALPCDDLVPEAPRRVWATPFRCVQIGASDYFIWSRRGKGPIG